MRDDTEKFAQSVVGLAVKGRSNQILLSFQMSTDFWFITLSPVLFVILMVDCLLEVTVGRT